jgi:uncharacterized protein (UPF0548 family)
MSKELRAEWRFGRGWSERELASRLEKLRHAEVNFHAKGSRLPSGPQWKRYYTQAIIAHEKPGPPEPGGAFEQAWKLIESYQFSDPGIVKAHYDPREPLVGRTMLLELQVMGFRFLCGTRVALDRSMKEESETSLGYRYDTLEGHIESGSEWFMLTKLHQTGEIRFRIHASWQLGVFPNWWSHLGFLVMGEHYQLAWHRLAYLRLRHFLDPNRKYKLAPVPTGRALVHTDADDADSELWILRTHRPAVQAGVLGGKRSHGLERIDQAGGKSEEAKRIERIAKGSHRRRNQRNSKYGGT